MISEGEILVIDDFVSLEYQEKIKQELLGLNNDFPWFYTEDVTSAGDYDSQYRPAMSHQYVNINDDDTSEIISVYHHLFTPLLSKACQHLKIPEMKVLQGRSFLQFPLKNIDTSAAESLPGVTLVLTGEDVKGKLTGNMIKDQPLLCWDEVKLVGDCVAAVAAVDEDTAQEAVALIDVEYEEVE